ncbi:MFS transporter [Sulfobacillus harzensis]|uniref:MFS transporter n=1 Tax=Sulfobacillus harzensis TaxID=2729629 RepID=A0A7Y0L360_9FIRM|nr:MFS transporter [Sulfobacillus harzensis]NMP22228.1 MFS transporter [Sulfobacillus harzensis]
MSTIASVDTDMASIAARVDRLPPSRGLVGLVARIAAGGWLEFFELALPGYISLGLINAGLYTKTATGPLFGLLDPKAYATFIAAFPAGMWIGTLVLGRLSDKYGRRTVFTIPMIGYSIMMLLIAVSSSPLLIDILRVLAGIGVGIQLINNDAFISEITPRRLRGKYLATALVIILTSYPITALLGYALVPNHPFGIAGWRWVVVIGGIMGFVVLLVRRGLPESPRWLAAHGRNEEAMTVLAEIEQKIRNEIGRDLPAPDAVVVEQTVKGSWVEMFQRKYGRRTLMMSIFQFTQTISVFGFTSWVPVFLADKGLSIVHSLQYTFEIAILTPFGGLLAMLLAERMERKWQLVSTGVIIAIVGLIFAAMNAPAWIVIIGGMLTLANYWMIGIFHTYNAEIFPTRIRAQAVSFTFSWSRISAIFVGYAVSSLLAAYGAGAVFAMIAGAMAVLVVAVATMGPRTNGQRLEELAS